MSSVSHPAVTTSTVHSIVAPSPIVGTADSKVGFFGSEGVVKGTLPADATDEASAVTLANALKAYLIDLGLAE